MRKERKEGEGWIEEWVNECTLKILFDLWGDSQPREWSYGVSHVCNLSVSLWDHTHTHDTGMESQRHLSVKLITHGESSTHLLDYMSPFIKKILMCSSLYIYIICFFNSSFTYCCIYCLISGSFFLSEDAHSHAHDIYHCCTQRCNQATNLCSTALWDTPREVGWECQHWDICEGLSTKSNTFKNQHSFFFCIL